MYKLVFSNHDANTPGNAVVKAPPNTIHTPKIVLKVLTTSLILRLSDTKSVELRLDIIILF
ncbi:hypothetical protein VIBNISOn1_1050040 [Vibrio nigripulchritudo SOn1]|uniref:Uncharacterized protein n=1 Tax=Vibrio nigripulchritudo SOn1 TaxID=1238450 RepID=A0AAV2VI98_9VIBR|nr:hypothetical protein VIBNISOn1_1050040 [Vibrio nigripulchritudo SOn1]